MAATAVDTTAVGTPAIDTEVPGPPAPPRAADLDAIARLAAHVSNRGIAAVVLDEGGERQVGGLHGAAAAQVLTGAAGLPVAALPLHDAGGRNLGTLAVYGEPGPLDGAVSLLLGDLADQAVALLELRRLTAAMAQVSTRDPLTGATNRRGVQLAIAGAIARAERGLGTPSLVVVEVVGFAALNGSLGRAAGDRALRLVADRLAHTARSVDTVARAGADRFLVLLEHTGGPGASAALARLRESMLALQTVEGDPGDPGGPGASGDSLAPGQAGLAGLRVALGMATYRPGDSAAGLVARAEAQLCAHRAGSC